MRVVIASAERALVRGLSMQLREAGHAVDQLERADEVPALVDEPALDLLVLDLRLCEPPAAAAALLRRLRQGGMAAHLIALTGEGGPAARIAALDLGADDCLSAPLSVDEICARVRAHLRRRLGGGEPLVKHGPLSFDPLHRTAWFDGELLPLSRREASLLEVLLQRAGRYVSKEAMIDRLFEWGSDVNYNCVEVYVHRLRKKVERGPVRILTARGVGYQLARIHD